MLDKIKCWLFGHRWSMYAGYGGYRVHSQAFCLRPGCTMTGKKYLERH